MKYKISVTTYQTGRAVYQAYVQKSFLLIFKQWVGLLHDGQEWDYAAKLESRADAQKAIDHHSKGNYKFSSFSESEIEK